MDQTAEPRLPPEGAGQPRQGDDTTAMDRFDRIVALVREMLDAPAGLVALTENGQIVVKSALGLPGLWQRGEHSPLAEGLCRRTMAEREPVCVEDAATAVGDGLTLLLRDGGMAACLAVPVHLKGRAVGALAVLTPAPRLWSARDRRRLGDFAAVIDGEIDLQAVSGERDAARREAELLAQEQSHRVKNSLAVAASLVTLSGTESDSAREVVRIARDRIAALSTAHSMLRTREGTGDLRSMFERMLSPYARSGGRGIELRGEPLPVPTDRITALSLIFHELATNACKYGGLGSAGSGVELEWQAEPDGMLRIEWRERVEGAAPGTPGEPERGFGSQLVELSVRQMSGQMQVDDSAGTGRAITLALPWPQAPDQ